MVATSFEYSVALVFIVMIYWILPCRLRKPILLIASILVYSATSPQATLILGAMILINYALGLWLGVSKRPKAVLATGLVIDLGLLVICKYSLFASESLRSLASRNGAVITTDWILSVIVPAGVSFFVFEFVGYLIDVYRGRPPVRSLLDFAVYGAFFPTRVSGPIRRVDQFVVQLENLPSWNADRMFHGLALIVRGAFKKLVLADSLSVFVKSGFDAYANAGLMDAWITVAAFTLQILFDFSGYTDMARGACWLLGFQVPENFAKPYTSQSVSEFWQRWHISLSGWLRDYLYIPLGGNRGGHLITYRNLMITMALGGLWHGASWTFVAWGLYHGCCLVVERGTRHILDTYWPQRVRYAGRYASALGIARTVFAVSIGWVFFRAESLLQAGGMLARMFGLQGPLWGQSINETAIAETLVIAVAFVAYRWWMSTAGRAMLRHRFRYHPLIRSLELAAMVIGVLLLRPGISPAFIYFGF